MASSSATPGGVGRPGFSTVDAPTEKGKVSELPSPYAKNSLATDRVRSAGPIRSTDAAYVSAVAWRLAWRCITPLGRPVVPEL